MIYLGDNMFKMNNTIIPNERIDYNFGFCNGEKILDVDITFEKDDKEINYFFETCCYLDELQKLKIGKELVIKSITDCLYSENGKWSGTDIDLNKDVIITYTRLSNYEFEMIIKVEKLKLYYSGNIIIKFE